MTVPTDSFSSCSKVKLEVSHHKSLDGGDWQSTKPLVFLLDEIADEKVKKQKKRHPKSVPRTLEASAT